ncbi:MAG: outer membrane beta-barrel protein [Gammaproteobacteria bacterium]
MSFAKIMILAAILTPVSTAFAQYPGLYVGLGLNRTSTHVDGITVDNQPISDIISGPVTRFSSSTGSAGSTTWMLYGGYRFTRFLAIEALYASLGEYSRSASGVARIPRLPYPYTTLDRLTLDGFGLTGLADYPFNDHLSIFGKFGIFHWSGKLTHTTSFTTTGLPKDNVYSSEKDSGLSPIFGIGAQYNFVHAVTGVIEWMQISKVGGNLSTGEDTVNLYTIGAQIHF